MSDLGEEIKARKKKIEERLESFTNLNVDDCIECRLVGGGGAILTGIYLFFAGNKRHEAAKRPILNRMPSIVASAVLLTLGICRLINYNPMEMLQVKPKPDSETSEGSTER